MINYIAATMLMVGVLFFAGTAVGMLRFPDLFTRIHAASKGDTLSSFFLLGACALYNAQDLELHHVLVSLKMLFILVFICLASPTAAHVITNAALLSGAQPWTKETRKPKEEEESA